MNTDNYSVRLCLFIRQLASEHIPLNRLIEVAQDVERSVRFDQTTKSDLTDAERRLSSSLGFTDDEMKLVFERANADLAEENKKLRDDAARVRGLYMAERELVEAYRRYSAHLSEHNQQMAALLGTAPREYKRFTIVEEPHPAGAL